MRREIICACLVVLCSLSAESQNFPMGTLDNSVVQIAVMSADGKIVQPIGTGFVAGANNLIVTAAHLYWQAGTVINQRKGGSIIAQRFSRSGQEKFRVPIDLAAKDDVNDIALFTFNLMSAKSQWPEVEIKALLLAEKEAQPGDDIVFVGYFGDDPTPIFSKGTISGWTAKPLDQVLIDTHVNRGQSGSPVVLLENGAVVGVTVGFVPTGGVVLTEPQQYSGLSRAVKIEPIRNLISSVR